MDLARGTDGCQRLGFKKVNCAEVKARVSISAEKLEYVYSL